MNELVWLQKSLNLLGYRPALPEVGTANPQTRAAIVWFQGMYGLTPDGLFQPQTRSAIEAALEAPEIHTPTATVIGVCVHGLGNDVLGIGIGMDTLAAELNQKPRCKFAVWDHDPFPWNVNSGNREVIQQYLIGASQGGARIVYIGHSLGAGLGIEIANSLNS